MKKFVHVLFAVVLISSLALPQTARIKTENVSPHGLTSLGLTTNSVSAGLRIIPNNTYGYFSAQNIANSDAITNATFELISKPGGSVAALELMTSPQWTMLKPDVKGEYQVKVTITTASGTDDTTQSFYSADFIGVGEVDGVPGGFPSCTSCHDNAGFPVFQAIFTRWATSGHANHFRNGINGVLGSSYGTSCFKCHTTGFDHDLTAANNGFDDVAATLGWTWQGPPNSGKWDSLKTDYSGLVKFAVIGCEMCHGPGGEHALGADKNKIDISIKGGNCAQCHDEPWRHNIFAQWENSVHSEAAWERTTGSSANTNNLGDCIRCHDGQGFINFTKGKTTDATKWTELANGTPITCATCHDPHGNSNEHALRSTPVGSDTLGNGYSYTGIGGKGQLCMNCHKSRRGGESYVLTTNSSSHFGPHGNPQSDVLLGQNAVQFGSPYVTNSHKFAVTNLCVDCHMVTTTDTGTVTRDKVGGHSWSPHYNGYDHTVACEPCHGPKSSFEDFGATMDYDGDGVVEPIPGEVEGLLSLIAQSLPPYGSEEISWQDIGTSSDSVKLKGAWWNYQLIENGSAEGLHNSKFAFDVLSKTYAALGGVIPVELLGFTAEMSNGLVALNWETATETNNRGFEIQRKTDKYAWQTIGFVSGKGTTTEMSNYTYSDNPVGITNYARISYRLKQLDYDGKANYSKEINVEFTGAPKTFSLDQNYPNPFNPATVIRYAVPSESKVKVVVYNLAGEVVKELVNEVQSAGFHESTFNTNSGINLSSGIYFYSIEAIPLNGNNSFRQTKKMILLK